MNIIVLGAGTVGASVAEMLCQQQHSVTVVDADPVRVKSMDDKWDVRAITGSASQSSVLFQAGVSSADICMAVTGRDEVNIVASSMAKAMGARRAIARVYSPVFRDLSTFDYQRHFGIDRMLSLEHLTAMELARSIRDPGAMLVEQFARGNLEALEFIVGQAGKATSGMLRELNIPANVRIGTIRRGKKMWIATADDQLEVGDRVTVIACRENMAPIRTLFKVTNGPVKRVVIAGGGETGLHLARMLESETFKVKIIEYDPDRCQVLAALLDNASVVNQDATLREVLEEERVGSADVFVACCGNDEANMMVGVEAKDVGSKRVLAVIGRSDYSKIVDRLGIDVAVSEREAMARQIVSFLNDGVIISRVKLPGGLINVIELEVTEGSPATQTTLSEMGLPERCLVAAIIDQDYVRVPGANDQIKAGDMVVLLVEDDVEQSALSLFS